MIFLSGGATKSSLNRRVEVWGRYKVWLTNGGCIPADNDLRDDSIGPEYQFTSKEQYQLEGAKDMKSRGLSSPDCASAVVLTFSHEVPHQGSKVAGRRQTAMSITDYDVLGGVQVTSVRPQVTYRELMRGGGMR